MFINPIKANMTEVITPSAAILFSYKTPVACRKDGKYYRTEKKWSNTTSRHINQWLDGREAETRPQSFFDNLAVS